MRLPNDSQRHAIYGQTGSGKTVGGLYWLSRRDFDKKPWLIINAKADPNIAKIPRLEQIGIRDAPPKQPGLYEVRPLPAHDEPYLTEMMWKIWDRGKFGLFVDEAYRIPRLDPAFNAILTQGRSKRIPVIMLAQRPAYVPPFFMSEADFHQVYHLTNPADIKRIKEWVPPIGPTRRDFHSQFYDVANGTLTYLAPVPPEAEIMDRFDLRMPRRIRHLEGFARNVRHSGDQRHKRA